GEIYGFLGPNGAGKSTTVHVLTTLLPPTAGRARVGGLDVVTRAPEVRGVIGAALQEVALDPHLSGREHVRLQASLHGMDRRDGLGRAAELLGRVGLLDAADRQVATYSGGMKRRLDLALALVHRPRVLSLAAVLAAFGQPYEGRPEAVSVRMPPGQNGVEGIVRALDGAGVAVADLALHAPTLDDVFLDKTGRTLEGAAHASEEVAA